MPVPKSKIQSYHYRRGGDTEDLLMTRAIAKFQQKPEHPDDEEGYNACQMPEQRSTSE
jgi:hypothetical protein